MTTHINHTKHTAWRGSIPPLSQDFININNEARLGCLLYQLHKSVQNQPAKGQSVEIHGSKSAGTLYSRVWS